VTPLKVTPATTVPPYLGRLTGPLRGARRPCSVLFPAEPPHILPPCVWCQALWTLCREVGVDLRGARRAVSSAPMSDAAWPRCRARGRLRPPRRALPPARSRAGRGARGWVSGRGVDRGDNDAVWPAAAAGLPTRRLTTANTAEHGSAPSPRRTLDRAAPLHTRQYAPSRFRHVS